MSQLAQGEPETMNIEGPATPGNAVVRREPLPKELAALGVTVAIDPVSDMQVLILPKEMRAKFNVLAPIQAFQQADPNWRPSLRVVELDPSKTGPHFYPQQGGKLAPRKQALELLADAAGVVQIHVNLQGRERIIVGDVQAETFTHIAVLRIRKSDGTLRTLEASRTYEPFAEYEEIKTSVASGDYAKTPGTPTYDAEVRKRWLNEIKFAKAKNESKAINRAFRSAIQTPHTYSAVDAAKPFVVVGWNLAPQDSTAVAAAIAQLYGAAPEALALEPAIVSDWDEPESVVGEIEASEDDSATEESRQATVEAAPPAAEAVVVGDTVSPAVEGDPVRESGLAGDDEPESGLVEPLTPAPPLPEPVISTAPVVSPDVLTVEEIEALDGYMEMKMPSGSYQGRSIGWTLEQGAAADEWLAYALVQPWPHDQQFKQAVTIAIKAHRPEIYAAWVNA